MKVETIHQRGLETSYCVGFISNVLPELGEETVPETSMEQILSGVLEHKYKYQTYFGLVNELLEKPSSSLIDRIAYKASFGFISELDKFILHIENTSSRQQT